MFTDFVLNGAATGQVGERMASCGFDPGLMRPWIDDRGRACVTVNTGLLKQRKKENGEPVFNTATGVPVMDPVFQTQTIAERHAMGLPCPVTNATLRKDQWILLDSVVQTAARKRLRAWADLRAANTYGGFDGMANPILEYERVTDVGEAVVDMDGMTEARNLQPKFDLRGMPLPITHADFFLSSRFLAVSRNRGTPADTLRAEMAGRRVGEVIEQTTIGVTTGTTYGDATDYGSDTSTVYGYISHPDRLTKTNMNQPTGSNGPTVLSDWLTCRELLYTQNFFGPFNVYVSTDYDQYLDNLFSTSEPSAGSLRKRLLEIDGINSIKRLDYLPSSTNPFTVVFVNMQSETAQAVNGMEITTVQWESMGGMRLNFKVMAIQVPRIRSQYVNQSQTTTKAGILQATTS